MWKENLLADVFRLGIHVPENNHFAKAPQESVAASITVLVRPTLPNYLPGLGYLPSTNLNTSDSGAPHGI